MLTATFSPQRVPRREGEVAADPSQDGLGHLRRHRLTDTPDALSVITGALLYQISDGHHGDFLFVQPPRTAPENLLNFRHRFQRRENHSVPSIPRNVVSPVRSDASADGVAADAARVRPARFLGADMTLSLSSKSPGARVRREARGGRHRDCRRHRTICARGRIASRGVARARLVMTTVTLYPRADSTTVCYPSLNPLNHGIPPITAITRHPRNNRALRADGSALRMVGFRARERSTLSLFVGEFLSSSHGCAKKK